MLRVTTEMTGLAGAPYFSAQYFAGTEPAEAEEATDAVGAFWQGLIGFITAGLVMKQADEVDVIDPATGLITDTHTVTGPSNTSTGNAPLPKATQGLLRVRTSDFLAGRRVQGRVFIPALANDAQVGGVPSGPFNAALISVGNDLLEGTLDVNSWGVWHRPNPDAEVPSVGSFHAATGVGTWSQFAVLRSRRD